jgi:4-diphosphocytidyl-2-C-methyl-D-erythritol kinase
MDQRVIRLADDGGNGHAGGRPNAEGKVGRWMIEAPAKLNLGLRIFPPRPDGFHDLESWMVPISWHDTLWVDVTGKQKLTLEVTGRSEGVPTEIEKNLVGRAALKLAAAAGMSPYGWIVLHKVLPPGGGLGGGSSDAASVLLALNEAWEVGWELPRLEALASELGSDVPLFVRGEASLCTGRGEIMRPLRGRGGGVGGSGPLFAVLLLPPFGCGTKEVYQAFDAALAGGGAEAQRPDRIDWERVASATPEELNEMLFNDLAEPAFQVAPALRELRDKAVQIAGQKVHVTGSGSTLYTLCGSGYAAGLLQARLIAGLGESCESVCAQVKV